MRKAGFRRGEGEAARSGGGGYALASIFPVGFWSGMAKTIGGAVTFPFREAWQVVTSTTHAILMGLASLPGALFHLVIRNEITVAFQQAAWAHALLAIFQGVAVGLLGLRIMWELWRFGVSRAEGEPVDLGRIGRGSVYALAGIFLGPWLALEVLRFGNGVVSLLMAQMAINQFNPALVLTGVAATGGAAVGAIFGVSGPLGWIIAACILIAVAILMFIVWMQSLIRAVEMVLAALGAPLAAIGFVSADDGAAAVWWRQTASLVAAQMAQVTMLYVAMLILSDPGYTMWLRLFGCIAALVVTIRAPHIVQQYAYHTGVGSTTTQMVQQVASVVGKSVLL